MLFKIEIFYIPPFQDRKENRKKGVSNEREKTNKAKESNHRINGQTVNPPDGEVSENVSQIR
jgi:hypothetical protein